MTEEQQPLYMLESLGLTGPRGAALQGVDWKIRDRAVTVLLGPAGTGKTALLRALSGHPDPPGWQRTGTCLYRGRRLWDTTLPADELAFLPQRRSTWHTRGAEQSSAPTRTWRDVLAQGHHTVLLDEPTVGVPASDVEELIAALRAHVSRGAALVVTHDMTFARRVADEVCLLCAGEVIASGQAKDFFDRPPNELAARFVSQGNCWPAGSLVPELPSHFHWLLPGRLAGMGRPGLLRDVEEDLASVAAAGVGVLVTLTSDPIPGHLLKSVGLQGRHFPVRDMGVPGLGPTARLCREIERRIETGGVALHCQAGLGRTGLLLACMLVWLGRKPDEAIREVRTVVEGYIQSNAQLRFVAQFADSIGVK